MGVEYHQCDACQESFYEECVTNCEGCGERICVSCVINLPERIRLGRGSIFDKTTDILSGEDGLLEEHCPFCSGDAVSADQIMNWLLRRVNMTEDEVAKQIREVTKQIREGKKRLTKEIAEEFLVRKDDFVDIAQFTELDDDAAESLSKHKGEVYLELDALPESAAEILRQHPSFQDG